MDIAIIIVFIGAILLFGFLRGFKERGKGENLYYLLALTVCGTVLILKSLDIWSFDPVKMLTEFFHEHGLNYSHTN